MIGLHILSPNAGEIMQGFATAIKCGVTKEQIDDTIGIHPTIAEDITNLKVDKALGDGKKEEC